MTERMTHEEYVLSARRQAAGRNSPAGTGLHVPAGPGILPMRAAARNGLSRGNRGPGRTGWTGDA